LTPMELVAKTLLGFEELLQPAARLFDSYNDFIGMLADEGRLSNGKTPRKHLEEIAVEELDSDPTFQRAREISHAFQEAVRDIFLRSNTELSKLTVEYGVF